MFAPTRRQNRPADSQGVEIRYYNIIYDLVDEVKAAMSGLLAPTKREIFLGYATIKQVFNISKFGKVAGCQVTEGKVERGAKVRLLRDNVVIHEGLACDPEALQGRRQRGRFGSGMRHVLRELSGYPRRRSDRVLPGRDDRKEPMAADRMLFRARRESHGLAPRSSGMPRCALGQPGSPSRSRSF